MSDPQDGRRQGMRALAAGYTLLGAVAAGLGIGYLIDQWLGSSPTAMAICAPVFIAVGLYQVVREFWPKGE